MKELEEVDRTSSTIGSLEYLSIRAGRFTLEAVGTRLKSIFSSVHGACGSSDICKEFYIKDLLK